MKPHARWAGAHAHACSLLAVDTAANSGWAIFLAGVKLNSGEVDAGDVDALVGIVSAAVKYTDLPSVLVLEYPFGGNTRTLVGLGAARGAWLSAWRKVHGTKTARRVVSVNPATWRAGFGIKGKLEPAMQEAMLRAHGLHYVTRGRPANDGCSVGPDEFEALMIGKWGSHAAKVGAVLPKRRRAG